MFIYDIVYTLTLSLNFLYFFLKESIFFLAVNTVTVHIKSVKRKKQSINTVHFM